MGVFTSVSGTKTRLSKSSLLESETLPAGSETSTMPATDRITVVPTALDDHTSAISELSTFTKGTTPSKSTNDLDSKLESEKESLFKSVTTKQSQTSKTSSSKTSLPIGPFVSQSVPFINVTDGLQDIYTVAPLIREAVMLESSPDSPVRRPKAGHHRDRMLPRRRFDSSDGSASTQRPESGITLTFLHFVLFYNNNVNNMSSYVSREQDTSSNTQKT